MYTTTKLLKYKNTFYIYIIVVADSSTHVPIVKTIRLSRGTTTVIVRGRCPIFLYGVCRIIDYELNCVKPNRFTK